MEKDDAVAHLKFFLAMVARQQGINGGRDEQGEQRADGGVAGEGQEREGVDGGRAPAEQKVENEQVGQGDKPALKHEGLDKACACSGEGGEEKVVEEFDGAVVKPVGLK